MNHPGRTEPLSHGVEIRWHDSGAEVAIALKLEGQDAAAALSQAWTCLAEAISTHKAESAAGHGGDERPGGSESAPPGSAAWWQG